VASAAAARQPVQCPRCDDSWVDEYLEVTNGGIDAVLGSGAGEVVTAEL